jgi:phosphate transport system substrate-binding protein
LAVIIAAGAFVATTPGQKTTTATSVSTATATSVSTATATSVSTVYTVSAESTDTALSGTLLETGSSLLYPAFNLWVVNFSQVYPNIHVTTGSTGSGTGQSDAESGTVQIGASDAYMTPASLEKYPTMLNIPLAISAQQVNFNIPVNGLNKVHLNMSGPVLAGIYNGSITTWNNPKIAALQSASVASQLPAQTIIPIHRQDSSGDTFIFTSYLSDSDPQWNSTIGYGTTVSWPAVSGSLAATGNSGMVTALTETPYSIAYVGISYLNSANQLGLGYAFLKNKAGNFVDISTANIQSAVNAIAPNTPKNEIISLIFAPGANSYPIVNYEYAIVNMHQPTTSDAQNIQALLTWIITYGNQQYYLVQVHFVALPSAVKQLSLAQINSITSP